MYFDASICKHVLDNQITQSLDRISTFLLFSLSPACSIHFPYTLTKIYLFRGGTLCCVYVNAADVILMEKEQVRKLNLNFNFPHTHKYIKRWNERCEKGNKNRTTLKNSALSSYIHAKMNNTHTLVCFVSFFFAVVARI